MSGLDDGWDDDDDLNLDGSDGGWGEDDDLNFDDEPAAAPAPPPPPRPLPASPTPEVDPWGDDDDLNFDDDPVPPAAAPVPAPPPPPPLPPSPTAEEDAWGDDDDLDLDFDDTPAPPPSRVPESLPDNSFGAGFKMTNAPPPPPPRPTIALAASEEDGWGDEDDIDLDDIDVQVDEPTPTSRKVPESPNNTQVFGSAERTVPESPDNQDGWGDDKDLNIGTDDTLLQISHDETQFGAGFGAPGAPETPEQEITFATDSKDSNGSGWEDDEDLFGDEEGAAPPAGIAQPMTTPQDAKLRDIQQQLETYVSSLDRIVWSINAVLEFEYNTPEKAQELVDYYSSRPQLAAYTRNKELPRMEYSVVLPFGHVETDKEEIGAVHLPDESLLSRCANQSLLADLLHQITGPDLIVRPAYLAVCVAHWCKFTIHFAGNLGGEDMVECACRLHLSLPTADGERLNIAEVTVQIVFKPKEPLVEYRILSIDVLLKDMSKLASTAQFLNMIEGHFDEFPGHEDVQLQNAPADMYRDVFLENSQKLLTQSTKGMKSALQQMESVVNLRSKLNIVKGGYKTISKFIPDTDQLLAAEEEEARNVAMAREQQLRQQQQQQREQRQVPPPPPQGHPQRGHPTHPQSTAPARVPPPPTSGNRPTSILGGIVSSGWSALANSIAIPDEDPAIYGAPPSPAEEQPKFYRAEPAAPSEKPPTLYNRTEPPPQFPRPPVQTEEQPTLYRKEPAVPAQKPPPTLYNRPDSHPPAPSIAPKPFHQLAEKGTGPISPPERPAIVKDSEPDGSTPAAHNPVAPCPPAVKASLSPVASPPPRQMAPSQVLAPPVVAKGATSSTSQEVQPPAAARTEPPGPFATKVETYENRVEQKVTAVASSSGRVEENTAPVKAPIISPRLEDKKSDAIRLQNQTKPLIADVDYNSDDDIIETCQRWRNPRPYRPYLAI